MPGTPEKLPAAGKRAPAFTKPDQTGARIRLSDLKGSIVVLYFYPKDNTPGCTIEAQDFRDLYGKFRANGIVVIGLSPDSPESHAKFAQKHNLKFPLVSDEDHAVAERYGVWVQKNLYGRKFWGVRRATFLVDARGVVAHVWPKVSVKGHAAEVLEAAKALRKSVRSTAAG